MRFCGRARATVRVGSKTFRYAGGDCSRVGAFFSVNIGTTVLDAKYRGPKPSYFGLTARRSQAGRRANATIAFNAGGRGYALTRASVSLAKGLRRGTFAGVVFARRSRVSGSFSC
jgi:hypothetical protein